MPHDYSATYECQLNGCGETLEFYGNDGMPEWDHDEQIPEQTEFRGWCYACQVPADFRLVKWKHPEMQTE